MRAEGFPPATDSVCEVRKTQNRLERQSVAGRLRRGGRAAAPRGGPGGRAAGLRGDRLAALRHWWLATARATARTVRESARSSRDTDRPSPSQSGTRQFGYSSLVPGTFCVRRSPTAYAASEIPIRTAGVRASSP